MTVTMTAALKMHWVIFTTVGSSEGDLVQMLMIKIFNNYVVSPVVTKFDFTKKLAGQNLRKVNLASSLRMQQVKKLKLLRIKENRRNCYCLQNYHSIIQSWCTHTYTVEE